MIRVLNFQPFGFLSKFFSLRKISLFYFLLFTFYFLLALPVNAQEEQPEDAVPPPVKSLTKQEKSSLEAEKDPKKYTKLAIELMEARLKKAEELGTQESYNEMFTELGGFHALMDTTLKFLNRNDTGSGKSLDNFKRFEMSLRAFTPRIEVIRRDLPERFEYYVRSLLKNVRETRAKAIEPLFSDTVVPDKNN